MTIKINRRKRFDIYASYFSDGVFGAECNSPEFCVVGDDYDEVEESACRHLLKLGARAGATVAVYRDCDPRPSYASTFYTLEAETTA
jgi:hypothetical protein